MQAPHGSAYLVCVPYSDDVGLKHLGDEQQPVSQLCGCLVQVYGGHQLWTAGGGGEGPQSSDWPSVLLMGTSKLSA